MFVWLVKNDLERKWKEAVESWFKLIHRNLQIGTEEDHESRCYSRFQGRNLDLFLDFLNLIFETSESP
jgi:hypothetical protein